MNGLGFYIFDFDLLFLSSGIVAENIYLAILTPRYVLTLFTVSRY